LLRLVVYREYRNRIGGLQGQAGIIEATLTVAVDMAWDVRWIGGRQVREAYLNGERLPQARR